MGYLTEVVIMNDALHEFQQYPKEFAEAIFKGMDAANNNHEQSSVAFHGYGNYLSVEPSRHADHEVLFFHTGNQLVAMGAYEKDWKNLAKRDPEYAKKLLKKAKAMIKDMEFEMKLALNKA